MLWTFHPTLEDSWTNSRLVVYTPLRVAALLLPLVDGAALQVSQIVLASLLSSLLFAHPTLLLVTVICFLHGPTQWMP